MRGTLSKSLLLSLLLLPAASSASWAAACDRLAGGRYLLLMEGTFAGTANSLSMGLIDFGGEHRAYKYLAQPKPATMPTGGSGISGVGYVDTVNCLPVRANANQATLTFASGGSLTVNVAADGASFTAQGVEANSTGMSGKAYKVQ